MSKMRTSGRGRGLDGVRVGKEMVANSIGADRELASSNRIEL
jgi:hypothetical protein